MKHIIKNIIIGYSIFALSGCGIQKFERSVMESMTTEVKSQSYTKNQVQEDIDFYLKSMNEMCPFPYLNTDSTKVYEIARRIKSKGDRNGKELYLDFMELSASFNTAHTSINPPKQMLSTYFARGGRVLPFTLRKMENDWVVSYIADSSAQSLQDEIITKINGEDISDLIESFRKYSNGKDIEEREKYIAQEIAFYLWLDEINAPYEIEYIDSKSGNRKKTSLSGYGKINSEQNSTETSSLNDYIEYKMINNDIGYINFKSMLILDNNIKKDFYKFLDTTFEDINQKKLSNLIIDLRENSGGRGEYGDALLNYFADKPYSQSSGEVRRVSQQFKNYISQMPWLLRKIALASADLKDYPKLPNGMNRVNFDEPAPLKKQKNRFVGKTWVLIGPWTYSAAMMTANAVEDHDLGILVGEPTGGVPNELSDVLCVKTPNSEISLLIPSTLFTRANGDASDPNPVMPDIEVKTTYEDEEKSIDPVMNFVLKKIGSDNQ